MAQIAYLLLCHKNAERVVEQARILTSKGDYVAIHADRNAGSGFYDALRAGVQDNPNVAFANRVACGWGEWSLVQASLNMIDTAVLKFPDATHFFLMSGDCMPIKPAHVIYQTLDDMQQDMIEHADFYKDNWIKTGMKEDRLIYRHWFNERNQKAWFYSSLELQRKLGLSRKIPEGLKMRIGSQWWVLRRDTIDKIRAFLAKRKDIVRFFRTTWIPDETFFQTLTMHLVPRNEVVSRPPTLLMFSDYGMPVTFHADHFAMLKSQGALFARKISDHDDALREKLGGLFGSEESVEVAGNSGVPLYDYVRSRGRIGRRFGSRIWEKGAVIGPDKQLVVLLCKKWHVAGRLIQTAKEDGMHAFGYVFDQDDVDLPDLGGLEKSRDKRGRHRRAIIRLLFEATGAQSLAICLDPSNVDAVEDFARDGCDLRVLEIDCDISDDWLSGHAERVGLGSPADQGDLRESVMRALRQNIDDEQTTIRDFKLTHHYRIAQSMEPGRMARPIADAFAISVDAGAKLARTQHLFED